MKTNVNFIAEQEITDENDKTHKKVPHCPCVHEGTVWGRTVIIVMLLGPLGINPIMGK